MVKIITYIFVHDQNIVKDFIECGKFDQMDNVVYMCVGNQDFSMVENYPNVVICNKLQYNIEEFPKLTSYTGWYAIWKNNLCDSADYVNLLEYDVNISNDFDKTIKENLDYDVIGYIPFNVHRQEFIRINHWAENLVKSILENYNIDVYNLIDSYPLDKECSMTSNHLFSKKSFEGYMNWVNLLIDSIKYLELSGHQIERSISLFYLINNVEYKLLGDILTHYQFDSHKTQGISQEKFKNEYNKLLK